MSSQQELLRPRIKPAVSLNDILATQNVEVIALPASTATEQLPVVSGITLNSASVEPGDVFVALDGLKKHGALFAQGAVNSGATVILTDAAGLALLKSESVIKSDGTADVIVVLGPSGSQLRAEAARWASLIYADASRGFEVSGITGTNGKTTTAFFLDAIHRAAGSRTALLGTVEMRLGESFVPSSRTTVEAPVLQGFFARCVEENIDHLTMEVSSHALSLDRVTGTHFNVVGFTNLQVDHLDFHHTMEEYFEAKASLFTARFARKGVIVIDDKWGRKLADISPIPVTTIRTPLCDQEDYEADWVVTDPELSSTGLGIDFSLVSRNGLSLRSHSPLLGNVNVSNAALATVMALESGIEASDISNGLNTLATVPGRMEVVSTPEQPLVVVDYAHTTEALEFALSSLKQSHHSSDEGKLIVVFGAAGDRDATKRPFMGAVSGKYADIVYVTDDDPYSEDPEHIRDQVWQGLITSENYLQASESLRAERYFNIAPREQAISQAISRAQVGDTVLLAGRGHETIQDIAGEQHVLDDREFAREQLAKH